MKDEERIKRITEETDALYRALHAVLDEETADRLFPSAWRHLRRIRKERHHRPEISRGQSNTPPTSP